MLPGELKSLYFGDSHVVGMRKAIERGGGCRSEANFFGISGGRAAMVKKNDLGGNVNHHINFTIGGNDLDSQLPYKPDQVMKSFLDMISFAKPICKIITISSLMHRSSCRYMPSNAYAELVTKTNKIIRDRVACLEHVKFLHIPSEICNKNMRADGVHLTDQGYVDLLQFIEKEAWTFYEATAISVKNPRPSTSALSNLRLEPPPISVPSSS